MNFQILKNKLDDNADDNILMDIFPESVAKNLVVLTKDYVQTTIVIGGILAVVYLIVSGFNYILAAGDDTKIKKAKEGIKYSIIGLIMILLSYGIVRLVRYLLTGSEDA